MKPIRALVLYAEYEKNSMLSYQVSWPRQLALHPSFDCVLMNIMDPAWMRRNLALRWRRFDLIILLHSVFSNSRRLRGSLSEWTHKRREPKVYFIGNEYKLMPEKMSFCEELGVSLLVSQSDSPAVQTRYRERLGCRVVGIPNAGLDARLFISSVPHSDRPIDLGYRAYDAPPYLGHDERRQIADYFSWCGPRLGLAVDISVDPADRFNQAGWAAFLNRCKGQLGTEAGGDYFELTDAIRLSVNRYVDTHPDATMEEVFELFFANYANPMPLRIITGRNAEAAGTKTVQILFEGHYSGYFQPDVHYIPLKKDFSNIDDVMAKFRDESYTRRITENAYNVAVQELTYEKLIDRFHDSLRQVI
jgi:hypothetical protein